MRLNVVGGCLIGSLLAIAAHAAVGASVVAEAVKAGDVIVEVAQEEVKSPAQVADKVEEAKKAGRKSVLMLIDRQGELGWKALRIDGKG